MQNITLSPQKETLIVVGLLILFTLPFILTDLDLVFQHKFFQEDTGWYLAKDFPWRQLRDFSSIPAVLVSVIALFVYILGFSVRKIEKYRKICLYLVIVMLIAPGLLINVVLKGNFGRPRPRHIEEFGGKYEFERPLLYDSSSPGKSFPCGHASMGYYFFVFYILYRKTKRRIAFAGLVFASLFGSLIGLARMIQGGHFFSDSIWSAALCYLSALWIYHFFKFDREFYIYPSHEMDTKAKRIRITIASFLIIALLFAVILATPVDKTHTVKLQRALISNAEIIDINLELYRAGVEIIRGDTLEIDWEYSGFGPPKSRLKSYEEQELADNIFMIDIKQYHTGFFTEFQQSLRIVIPQNKETHLRYKNGDEYFNKTYIQN